MTLAKSSITKYMAITEYCPICGNRRKKTEVCCHRDTYQPRGRERSEVAILISQYRQPNRWEKPGPTRFTWRVSDA